MRKHHDNPAAHARAYSRLCVMGALLCAPVLAQAPKPAVSQAKIPRKQAPVSKQTADMILLESRYANVRVENVQLWSSSACGGKWSAQIVNVNDQAIGPCKAVPYQYRPDTQEWSKGPAVSLNLDKNQQQRAEGTWTRQFNTSKFKVAFQVGASDKSYREVVVEFPLHDGTGVSLEGIEVSDEGLTTIIQNGSSKAVCLLFVELSYAKPSAPDTWLSGGGHSYSVAARTTERLRPAAATTVWKERKAEGCRVKVKVTLTNPEHPSVRLPEMVYPL